MKYRTGIIFAVLLHLILLGCITTIYWSNNKEIGMQANSIQSYIYAQKQVVQRMQEQKNYFKHNTILIKQSKIKNSTSKKATKNFRQKDIGNMSKATVIPTNLTQGQYNELLILLHNAIAKHQLYPATAELLQQQGMVILSFSLQISGEITHIKIVKSSGFESLDKAAVTAVQATSPFTLMKLQSEQQIEIKINFV